MLKGKLINYITVCAVAIFMRFTSLQKKCLALIPTQLIIFNAHLRKNIYYAECIFELGEV